MDNSTRRPKSPLNGAPFLQPVQDPNPSCRSSAGQFNLYHILQNESGAWIGRVGELALSQLQQLPVLVQSVQGQGWRGDTAGLEFFRAVTGFC